MDILTLATRPDILADTLRDVFAQSVRPERVIVYIANDRPVPDWRVADEQYVPVPRGMVAQRALPYTEIDSEYILTLDDDLALAPDLAKKLLTVATENQLDAVAADIFANHRMSAAQKCAAFLAGGIRPHHDSLWSIKVRRSAAFAYLNNPIRDWYRTQSAAGGAILWRRKTFLDIHIENELWLDRLGFAYGEDQLTVYKAHVNGLAVAMHMNCGIVHKDAKSSSGAYHADPDRLTKRMRGIYLLWRRSCYRLPDQNAWQRLLTLLAFNGRLSLIFAAHVALTMRQLSLKPVASFFKGLSLGRRFAKSDEFTSLPPYILR